MVQPIRLALIGAGIFARDAHVPAIRALGDRFEIAAVYSRTRASAEALLPHLPGAPDIYTDLDALLTRPDIEAVDVLLPIEALATAVEMALAAGKHVVSEKPVTPDVATGKRLIAVHRAYPQAGLDGGGKLALRSHIPARRARSSAAAKLASRSSPICRSTSRVDAEQQVLSHRLAAFRDVPRRIPARRRRPSRRCDASGVGRNQQRDRQVRQARADLPPADTLTALMQFESGVIGSYSITYAGVSLPSCLTVDRRARRAASQRYDADRLGQRHTAAGSAARSQSVNDELAAFADAVRAGKPHRNSPLEALHDVAVIEAMLKSGQSGARVEVDKLADMGTQS